MQIIVRFENIVANAIKMKKLTKIRKINNLIENLTISIFNVKLKIKFNLYDKIIDFFKLDFVKIKDITRIDFANVC